MKLNSLSTIISLSLAVPLAHCAVPPTFVLVAHAPGTPLDGKPVNANGLAFWVGKPTLSYCPEEVLPPGACPPGNQTVVAIGEDVSAACFENAICGAAGVVCTGLVSLLLLPSPRLTLHNTSHYMKEKQASKQASTRNP